MKTLICLCLITLAGCTSFISIGKQYEFDELIIRKYQSKTDVPPELLEMLFKVFTAASVADCAPDQTMAGGSFNEYQLSKWSKAVRDRDSHRCFMCGSSEKVEAHHIMIKSLYPETAYSLWNGITICDKCHLIIHTTEDNWRRFVPMFFDYTLQFEGGGKP